MSPYWNELKENKKSICIDKRKMITETVILDIYRSNSLRWPTCSLSASSPHPTKSSSKERDHLMELRMWAFLLVTMRAVGLILGCCCCCCWGCSAPSALVTDGSVMVLLPWVQTFCHTVTPVYHTFLMKTPHLISRQTTLDGMLMLHSG